MSNQMRCWTRLAAVAAAIPVTAGSLAGQAADPRPTPKVFSACYAPLTGVVYRIKESGLPAKCFFSTHVEFSWTDGQGALRSGDAAGGDLLGTFPNPTVSALQRRPVSSTTPTNGQMLAFDGTSWAPTSPPAAVTAHSALTGLENDDHPQYLRADGARGLAGNLSAGGFKLTNLAAASTAGDAVPFEQAVKQGDPAAGDLSGSFSNLAVVGLQRRAVSGVAPTGGQVLTFDGSAWAPSTPAAGGTSMPCAGCVDAASLRNGVAVRSVNGLSDAVTLAAGSNVTITPSGQTLTISAAGGGAGGATDHGALTGLGDDDHPQYLLANGVRSATSGLGVTGSLGLGSIPTTGAGTRLMWYPKKAAFRAGHVFGTQWDDASIGVFSTAMGASTTASGDLSTAMGTSTTASGGASTAMGDQTTASGNSSTAMGSGTTASGLQGSIAMGKTTTASGETSTAMGWSTIASGHASTAMGVSTTASGSVSTAMGANTTASGSNSTAMGFSAHADFFGSFVYGDLSTNTRVTAGAPNRFVVRAAGGTIFFSNSTHTAGVSLAPGAGAWADVSDVNRKQLFRDVNGDDVLAKIARMPVREWSYKAQHPSIRHLGPTAQDFYSAFRLGESDTTITTTDIAGINLLAVQALERRTREVAALRAQVADLERRLARVEGARKN